MQDYSGNAPSLRSQFAVALTFSMALPIIAIGGLAFAVWRNVRFSPVLDQPHIVYFSAAAGAIVLIVLVTTLAWNRMWRTLRARVEAMSATCRSVAEGGLDERVPVIGDDMLAGLSASVNAVLDTFQNNPNGQDTATLQGQIEKLLQQVSAVGDGDLRVQADVTPDTLGVLANSFNYMIEELVKVVSRVQSTTQQVTSSTRRILDRSRDLSRSAEAQRQQMMQASEQVEALAAFMLSVGRNAMISASASQETLTSSREGLAAVSATIEGMQHIRENVQETSKRSSGWASARKRSATSCVPSKNWPTRRICWRSTPRCNPPWAAKGAASPWWRTRFACWPNVPAKRPSASSRRSRASRARRKT